MIKIISFVCLLLCFNLFGQDLVTIKGRVVDSSSKLPLGFSTVYLTNSNKYKLIGYAITDLKGDFELRVTKTNSPSVLKVSNVGFKDYQYSFISIKGDLELEPIFMEENVNQLDEVIIKYEIPPVRMKKDTLEFNASSFKVRPDSNVETLLKQLPGVEIGTDGKITVNGKVVNQILVNGKPFFDKSGKIAIQNLPSDLINKVQISDTKTKAEQLSGKSASSNNSSINLTIDKDKNKGMFGKVTGGYGTNDRYESSLLANKFNDKMKISLLMSANNINSTGFSMDEIFDNMGGGRNSNTTYNDDGSFGVGNDNFESNTGITTSKIVGLNYRDQWAKKFDQNASYIYSNSNSENKNDTKQTNFFPDGEFVTNSSSQTEKNKFAHNFDLEFEYRIDSTATIVFIPNFSKSNFRLDAKSSSSSLNENNTLLNENFSDNYENNNIFIYNGKIDFYKSFRKRKRFFNFSFENSNSENTKEITNKSETISYQNLNLIDNRNQFINIDNKEEEYKSIIGYNEPLTGSLSLNMGINLYYKKSIYDTKTFDLNLISDSYTDLNQALTSFLTSLTKTISPTLGFSIEKNKFSFALNLGGSLTNFDNSSLYLTNETNLNREYKYPNLNSNFNIKLGKSISIWFSYYYNVNFPEGQQILPVENLIDPLNSIVGNENLDPNKSHNFYLSFREVESSNKSFFSIYINGLIRDSNVVGTTIFDASGKRKISYENVSDTYSYLLGGNWYKSIKNGEHTFKYGIGLDVILALDKGFTNNQLYSANAMKLIPNLNITYDYGSLLTIAPSYSVAFDKTSYTNYLIDTVSNNLHKFNIQTTNYWPKNFVFGNDLSYVYNSNIADGFKKDFYLWNISLGYSIFNKKLLSKIKFYDVLNQNQSIKRSITPNVIRDESDTVLKRYIMFSLTYKI